MEIVLVFRKKSRILGRVNDLNDASFPDTTRIPSPRRILLFVWGGKRGLAKFLIARYYLAANFLLHLRGTMLNWGNDSANI